MIDSFELAPCAVIDISFMCFFKFLSINFLFLCKYVWQFRPSVFYLNDVTILFVLTTARQL